MSAAVLSGLAVGAAYVLMSLGFTLELGIADIVNTAHGAFVVASMYATLEVVGAGVPVYLAIALVGLAAGVVSYPVYKLLIEPARAQSGHRMQLVVTLLLLSGLTVVFQLVFGADVQSLGHPFGTVSLLGGTLSTAQLVVIVCAVVISVGLFLAARYTEIGKIAYVASLYPLGARSVGIPVQRVYEAVFCLAGALAGIAGGFIVTFQSVEPTQSLQFVIVVFLVTLVGRTHLLGCLFVGFGYGVVQAVLGYSLDNSISGTLTLAVLLVALVAERFLRFVPRLVWSKSDHQLEETVART